MLQIERLRRSAGSARTRDLQPVGRLLIGQDLRRAPGDTFGPLAAHEAAAVGAVDSGGMKGRARISTERGQAIRQPNYIFRSSAFIL